LEYKLLFYDWCSFGILRKFTVRIKVVLSLFQEKVETAYEIFNGIFEK
jgi:hypothetical protein